jgi:hypothetical protein
MYYVIAIEPEKQPTVWSFNHPTSAEALEYVERALKTFPNWNFLICELHWQYKGQ